MENYIKNGIIELLRTKNISKSVFAHIIGVDNKTVELWIAGAIKPDVEQLIKITKMYNVTVDYILFSEKRAPLVVNNLDKDDKDLIYFLANRLKSNVFSIKPAKFKGVPQDIHDKIKYLRTDIIKYTQSKFAKCMNVSSDTVKRWEGGISTPNTDQILVISLLCGVSTDYLIFDKCPEQLSLFFLNSNQYNLISKSIDLLMEKRNNYEE